MTCQATKRYKVAGEERTVERQGVQGERQVGEGGVCEDGHSKEL